MKLKEFCKENNYKCKNCIHSYWNHLSENEKALYCNDHMSDQIDEEDVCINYSDEEDSKQPWYDYD